MNDGWNEIFSFGTPVEGEYQYDLVEGNGTLYLSNPYQPVAIIEPESVPSLISALQTWYDTWSK